MSTIRNGQIVRQSLWSFGGSDLGIFLPLFASFSSLPPPPPGLSKLFWNTLDFVGNFFATLVNPDTTQRLTGRNPARKRDYRPDAKRGDNKVNGISSLQKLKKFDVPAGGG